MPRESVMLVMFSLFRTNENNSVVIPPVPEEVVINGEQSDDEEEVPPSDDEEQEDSKDYCIGEYQLSLGLCDLDAVWHHDVSVSEIFVLDCVSVNTNKLLSDVNL